MNRNQFIGFILQAGIGLFVVLWCGQCLAAELDIVLEGVGQSLQENIRQHLRIFRQRETLSQAPGRLKRLHRLAEKDIREALKPLGYYNPTVHKRLEVGPKTITARYTIDPGPPVIVHDVRVRLEGEGKTNRLLLQGVRNFGVRPELRLEQQVYEEEKKRLLNLAYGEGYLDSRYTTQRLLVDRDRNQAEIDLVLDTGRQYYFGETTSEQQIIRNELLQNYLPYREGDVYTPSKLVQLQAELYASGFFGRVAVHGDLERAHDQAIPVEIALEPLRKRNQYSLGVGYATDTGPKARFDWENRLLNERGHSLRAGVLVAELETQLSFTYRVPLQNPRVDRLVSNLSYQRKSWEDTWSELFSAAMTRSSAWKRFNIDTTLAYRNERYRVGSRRDRSSLLIPGINIGYVWAENLKDIKNGYKASIGLLGSKKELFSDTDFLQLTLDGKLVISPLDGWRFTGRGTVGLTFVDDVSSIPPSLRFYAGGDNTIRGYRYKSIGPKDEAGNVVGGTYLVIGSVELERFLSQNWSLAVFLDGGNAMDDLDSAMQKGAGCGIRYKLPFGQIRLDAASAITEEENPWRLHLSVGGEL